MIEGLIDELEALVRANLFLVPLDDHRHWYRFHHLFAEVLDNAMDEAVAKHARLITVDLDADGWLSVRDDGRGIPVDPHPKFPKKSALEVIMTTLHAGPEGEIAFAKGAPQEDDVTLVTLERSAAARPSDPVAEEVLSRFSVPSEPGNERLVLARVAEAGPRGVAAGDIARSVRCPASTLSFHLKELSRTGLLEGRPRAEAEAAPPPGTKALRARPTGPSSRRGSHGRWYGTAGAGPGCSRQPGRRPCAATGRPPAPGRGSNGPRRAAAGSCR